MTLLVSAALLLALATDPPPEDGQRGSAPTSADANRAGGSAQRSTRADSSGGDERTGPPAAGIQSGQANGMAGGRTDEGPRGGTGIRDSGDRPGSRAGGKDKAQARGRNRKGSFDRPAQSPPDMNRDPRPMGSGAPAAAAGEPAPRGRNIPAGPQQGAAGGVVSGSDAPGGSSPTGPSGKGAETQPDKREKGSEPDSPR